MTAPLTTPRALAALQDAIRAELREELIDQLRNWWEDNRDTYTDDPEGAISDAITTLEG